MSQSSDRPQNLVSLEHLIKGMGVFVLTVHVRTRTLYTGKVLKDVSSCCKMLKIQFH